MSGFTITTKYNTGDVGYIIRANTVRKIIISAIFIEKTSVEKISYYAADDTRENGSGTWTDFQHIKEDEIYLTKEELLKSL